MHVSPATADDLPALTHMYAAVANAMRDTPYDAHWDMSYHPTEKHLRAAAAAGDLFICREETSAHAPILGAFILNADADEAYAQAAWTVPETDGIAVIHLLAVSTDARGRGIGHALVTAAKEAARKRDARSLRLDVLASNTPAVALYLSEGFSDLGVFTLTYDGGFVVSAHLMEYDLASMDAIENASIGAERTLLCPVYLAACELCPRRCRADRLSGHAGICGATDTLKLARAALHMWEEPPISGEAGSGTIFFSGCPLKCVYCQNHEISTGNFGIEVPPDRLVEIMLELEDQGALNINLVTATHYAHLLPETVGRARARGLSIPIVYNTSGYERVQAVRELDGIVDIWLTDFKYADASLASRLSHVPDYPTVARAALAQMARQIEARGGERVDEDGIMKRGIIVRHLVLPGHADDSCAVLDAIWETAGDVPISVMSQYTPNERMRETGGELARAVTPEEYELVLDHADDLGFTQMFWQEGGAVDESFTPAFDTSGVLAPADGPIRQRA